MKRQLLVCAALAALFVAGPSLSQTAVPGASYDAPPAVVAASPGDEEMAIALELFAARNYDEGLAHLVAAAEGGNVGAQVMLGMMYLHGPTMYNLDVRHDVDAALALLNRAALSGSAVAKFTLANIELFGLPRDVRRGVPPGILQKPF